MAVSNLLVVPKISHCGLKEGIWSVKCFYAPNSFPAQVSVYHEKITPDRHLASKFRTENSLTKKLAARTKYTYPTTTTNTG